jgi:hypothetical protein
MLFALQFCIQIFAHDALQEGDVPIVVERGRMTAPRS